jgi:hypothetical protein
MFTADYRDFLELLNKYQVRYMIKAKLASGRKRDLQDVEMLRGKKN